MSGRIPLTVSREDYLAALQPLLDLLNVTPEEVFASGLHITDRHIRFTVVALPQGGEPGGLVRDGVRRIPVGIKTDTHPQGDEFAELGFFVDVEIL